MRQRYVIERDVPSGYCVTEIDAEGESVGSTAIIRDDYVADCKLQLEELFPKNRIHWKEAPKEWQPETLWVTNWFDPEDVW